MIDSSIFRQTPYWLQFLFEGQMFNWFNTFNVGAVSTVYYMLRTGNRLHHTLSRTATVNGGGPLTITLYDGATVTTNGTLKPPANMDRRSAKVNDTQYYINPTGVTGGTIIDEMYIATGGGPNTSSSLASGATERLLKPNTTYVVSILNSGAQASIINVNTLSYESNN